VLTGLCHHYRLNDNGREKQENVSGVIAKMIALQRLNGQTFVLSADFIESLESTPDTVIKLHNGKVFVVKNSVEDIVRKIVKYKQLCNQTIQVVSKTEFEREVNK
jgi:flagellar protein FlbD